MRYKHGCVIVKGGKIISANHNTLRNRWHGTSRCSTHAEMATLLSTVKKQCVYINTKIQSKAYNADLYVVRTVIINGEIKLSDSKPCKYCLKMCKNFGVKRIYYSNDNGNIIKEKTRDMISTHISYGQKVFINII